MTSALSPAPEDEYKWDLFFGDQECVPWIFHGTSTIHEAGIRRHGLAFAMRPYKNAEIAEIVRILERRKLYGPDASLGVLAAFTTSTAKDASVSLTFDWVQACQHAVLNRGGETIEYLVQNLEWALEPEQREHLSTNERTFLTEVRDRIEPIATTHVPLVVAAELPRTWYLALPFFADRNAFTSAFEERFGELEFVGRYNEPGSRAESTAWRGREFRVAEVGPEQLRVFTRLPSDESMREQMRRIG